MDSQLRGLGGFDQVLADMVDAGLASRKMVDRLFALTGVRVAPNTIRRWAHEIEDERKAARLGGAS